MGPLTKLVEERSDVTEDDLLRFFDKQSELHSPVWLLIVGLLLGGGSLGIFQLIREAGTASSTLTGVWFQAYLIMFIIVLLLIPMGLAVLIFYIVNYNPFNVQGMLMRDYMDARAKLRDKLKSNERKSAEATETTKPESAGEQTPEPSKELGLERVKFFWDYHRSHLTSRLVIIFSALVAVATIANTMVASPIIRLSPIAEVGVLSLMFVFIMFELADVLFRMKQLASKTEKLLGDISKGNPVPSLTKLCGIEYEPKSGWDELARVNPRLKAELIILMALAILLLYLGFGGVV